MEEEQNNLIRFRYETDEINKMDLSVFVKSLNGIYESYETFMSQPKYKVLPPHSLKIVEIRHKCIEIDLLSVACNVVPILTTENIHTGIEFLKRLYELTKFFSSVFKDINNERNVIPPTLQESQQFCDIIAPVANGQAKQFNGVTINGDVNINVYVNNTDAPNMMANIEEHIKSIEEEHTLQRDGVLLTIHQARNSSENSGDKSIVNEISKQAVKTTFESSSIKNQMLHPLSGNPFDQKYLVDILVSYKNNKPTEYRILKLREVIPLKNAGSTKQIEFDFDDNQLS